MIIVICLLMKKKSTFLKQIIKDNKNVNLPTQFCRRSVSNKFDTFDPGEVSLKENANGFYSITLLLINLTY